MLAAEPRRGALHEIERIEKDATAPIIGRVAAHERIIDDARAVIIVLERQIVGFKPGAFVGPVRSQLRGSAFGFFNLATGLALLFASLAAGLVWDALGPQATFISGALFATIAALLLLAVRARERAPPASRKPN